MLVYPLFTYASFGMVQVQTFCISHLTFVCFTLVSALQLLKILEI